MTLSGSDTLAHYQQVLDKVTFSAGENPTNYGSNPTRTVTWTLNDGGAANGSSAVQTTTVSITNVNDAPILAGTAATASYTEEGPATTLSPSVTVSDPGNLTLASATVKIVGGAFAGDADVLTVSTAGTSISASYNSTSETLILSGSDTLAHYQMVLRNATFAAGENPTNYGSNPTRTVTWTLNDGGAASAATTTLNITNVNDQPTLSNVAASLSFTPGQAATISPALSISDPDNLNLVSATVSIAGGSFAGDGDVLAATTANTAITASYNSTTETLTLSGSDTLAHYKQVLDSVTFASGWNPTNGGVNKTRTLTWVVNDGSASNNLSTAATTTISIASPLRNDFNADALSDFLWQNNDGTPAIWEINGTSIIGGGALTNPGTAWQVMASGDFNHDLKADIVFQNTDGTPRIWLMNGASVASTVTLVNPGSAWHVIATGDFDDDGNADLLFQNADGAAAIWLMNGTAIIAGGVLAANPGVAWHVIGAGDFNGDGRADILWQNTDGTPAIWEMNGTTVIGGGLLTNAGSAWHVINAGDFNGDGKADILWQNADGTPAIWEMNGTTAIGGGLLTNRGTGWNVIGTGDFNADGKSDILWQNTDGTPGIWEMNGTTVIGSANLVNPGSAWHLKDDGPFAADHSGTARARSSGEPPDALPHLIDPAAAGASNGLLMPGPWSAPSQQHLLGVT